MIEVNGKNYELKFNLGRLKLVEKANGMPTVADIVRTNGALSISTLEAFFSYCLKEEGADVFLPAKKGAEIADALIETEGYMKVNNMVIEKLSEDIPFLFPTA